MFQEAILTGSLFTAMIWRYKFQNKIHASPGRLVTASNNAINLHVFPVFNVTESLLHCKNEECNKQ